MHILEAALAFAISMLLLSMIVTTIVETIHRIFGIREKGLEIMLQELYDEIIEPQIKGSASKPIDATAADQPRSVFVTALTRNKIGEQANTSWLSRKTLVRPGKLTALSTIQFIQRFADTDAGKALRGKAALTGKRSLDHTITNIARRYEEIGNDASEYFGSRTKLVSIVISMLLAFAINIDALQLFKGYMTDDDLRASVIAQSQQIQDEFSLQQVRSQRLLAELESGEQLDQEKNIAALEAASQQIKTKIDTINSSSLPVGWSYFPYCYNDSTLDRCANGADAPPTATYIVWFLGVILGGVLVGLGGPFWFDAIRNLTLVLRIAKTGSGGQKARDNQAVVDGIKPKSVAEAFDTAGRSLIGSQTKRVLLQPNGARANIGGQSS